MPKIHQLPLHEAQKIAAGEVVERPANVVKELVENAIDAGATAVTIKVTQAGKVAIQVIDNGCGMDSEDARLCFAQHATSKVKSIDDLAYLQTFGFRGEALASIAAVSKITLITKENQAPAGIRLQLEQGTVIQESQIACTTGTDILIEDLFFNVPARKKFLKTTETEWRAIVNLFTAFCMSYQTIHFKLEHDGSLLYNCPPVTTQAARLTQLWEYNNASNFIPLTTTDEKGIQIKGIQITGMISDVQYTRYDRNNIYLFVNKRWIKNQKLSTALIKGYLNILPPNKFPAASIFITVNQADVDINIHPRKEEVQFLHPRTIETLLQSAVKKTFEEKLSTTLKAATSQFDRAVLPAPYYPPLSPINIKSQFTEPPIRPVPIVQTTAPFTSPVVQQPEDFQQKINATQQPIKEQPPLFTVIGQLNNTYILLETEQGLMMVDQHAAHERILFELFAQRFDEVATVKLLFPQIIPLRSQDLKILQPYLPFLRQYGIEVEPFGHDQLIIQSTPVHLKDASMPDFIQQMMSWITEQDNLPVDQFSNLLHEKIQAHMACKAAIKAGDVLSPAHIEKLLTDLYTTDNRFTCPHGRPTSWLLPLGEIEKKFKRDYRAATT